MRFSERTAWDLEHNAYNLALAAARAAGPLLDLTVANPTVCGFELDAAALLAPLHSPQALRYTPAPFGMPEARAAVARYYQEHGAVVDPAHLCLTTSTSEAYGFLFQLLCDPGDEVLIARPSYPLFDLLARLHDVRLREYPLFYDPAHGAAGAAWGIVLPALEAAVNERTRAIIVVHPNNPTGNYVADPERQALQQLCVRHGLALLVDEVFLDYPLPEVQARSFTCGESPALLFVLSGLSKVCALPQMKLSWMAVRGPAATVRQALARLEIIADTYLSLNAPVQQAASSWLDQRHALQGHIRERLARNVAAIDRCVARSSVSRLALEGGWTAVLRVPRHVGGQEFALACVDRGVIVQPGELYGLPGGRAVVSLLTPPEVMEQGLERLATA